MLGQLSVTKPYPRGGYKNGSQFGATERNFSNARAGYWHMLEQLPVWRILPYRPAVPKRHPETSVTVEYDTVRMTLIFTKPNEHFACFQRRPGPDPISPDNALGGIHMISRLRVIGYRQAVAAPSIRGATDWRCHIGGEIPARNKS